MCAADRARCNPIISWGGRQIGDLCCWSPTVLNRTAGAGGLSIRLNIRVYEGQARPDSTESGAAATFCHMLIPMLLAAETPVVDPWWQVFGRLHPLVLHFPIVLIMLGALVVLVQWVFWRRGASGSTDLESYRRGDQPSSVVQFCLWGGVGFAGIAVWTGWVLGDAKTDDLETLLLHRWFSIAVLVAMVLTAVFDVLRRSARWPWATPARLLSFVAAAILVAITGHLGAEMKWGPGYVLKPLAKARAAEAAAAGEANTAPGTGDAADEGAGETPSTPTPQASGATWVDVEALLSSRCERCHGEDKQKGSMQLIPWASMFEGNPKFWVVKPGDPDASLLLTRVGLPTTDDDRMPPEGEGNPLTDQQQTLLRDWIAAGAPGPHGQQPPAAATSPAPSVPPAITPTPPESTHESQPPSTGDEQPSTPPSVQAPGRTNPTTVQPGPFDQAAEDEVIASLRARGVRTGPLHGGSPWLEVDFARLEPPATDADCDGLGALAGNLWTCSVAGTSITDAAMATLATCLELRRLRLDRTSIGDAGIAAIESLQRLEMLNCFDTNVSDVSVEAIANLRGLKSVYLGSTKMTDAGLTRLRKVRPDVDVHGNASAPTAPAATDETPGAPAADAPAPAEPEPTPPAAAEPEPAAPAAPEQTDALEPADAL